MQPPGLLVPAPAFSASDQHRLLHLRLFNRDMEGAYLSESSDVLKFPAQVVDEL